MEHDKTQLGNALLLRYVLIGKDERGEDSGTYLDNWASYCGTYKCVAGDYVAARYGIKDPHEINIYSRITQFRFYDEFGFPPERFCRNSKKCKVFGSYGWGTIKQRIEYVEYQIVLIWGSEVLQ